MITLRALLILVAGVLFASSPMSTYAQPSRAPATGTQVVLSNASADSSLRSLLQRLDPNAEITEHTEGNVTNINVRLTDSKPAEDKAGIFSTRPVPPLRAVLQKLAPGASITEQTNGDRTSFVCVWPEVTVRFTLAPDWPAAAQRPAWKNWVFKFPEEQRKAPGVETLLHKIDGTVASVGSVVTPRYDPAGKAASLVLGLTKNLDGFVYAQDSLYDPAGSKIIGASNAPAKFGDQK